MRTQCEQVLEWLRKAPITDSEARDYLGIRRLAARVHNLRDCGHEIFTEMIPVTNRHGSHAEVARYWLIREARCAA